MENFQNEIRNDELQKNEFSTKNSNINAKNNKIWLANI